MMKILIINQTNKLLFNNNNDAVNMVYSELMMNQDEEMCDLSFLWASIVK